MEGVDPNDEALLEIPIDDGEKRRRATAPTSGSTSKARPIVLACVVAILGVVVANLALGGGGETPEEAPVDDAGPTEFPDALAARPDSELVDLTDGQTVRYELDSLPFSVSTVTVVCLSDVPGGSESVLDECDSGTAQRRTTSPGGVLEADLIAYRQIAIGGFRRIDCAEQACEFRTYADQAPGVVVGRATLGWADLPAERLGPQIVVEFDDDLTPTSPFVVVGSGFPADTSIHIRPCRVEIGADPFACDWVLADEVIQTGPDGTFRHDDLADWEIGFGLDAITCDEIDAGRCAMTVSLPGAERQPAAVPLDITSDRLDVTIELPETFVVGQTEGLVDGDLVDITADEWFFSSELEVVICAAGPEPSDCTWLALSRPVLAGVEIPRAFLSWRGTRHDCVEDGPCVLSVFSFRDPDQRLEVPIAFDPDAELRSPEPIVVAPTENLVDGELVTIEFADLVSVPLVSVCAVGENLTCQPLPPDSISGTEVGVRVPASLDTPTGLHNCLIDGPCELAVWDAATVTRFETAPLGFAPVTERPLSGIVRPADGIRHGDTVQVAISDAIDDVSVSMCAVDGACVPILVTATTGGRGVVEFTAVQRFEVQLDDGTLQRTDCAVNECELRISDGWTTARRPVQIVDDPPATAALAIETAEPLPLDETIIVRGRGFTPTVQPSEIRLVLCPPWAEVDSSCVRVGTVSTRRLPAEGTFETPITIPSSAFTTGFQNAMDRCGRECVLVARPLLGEAVELPVIRDTTP